MRGCVTVHEVRDLPYIYKDQSTIIPANEAEYCRRYGELLDAFQKKVNSLNR
ncbi:hypothetical protein SAMN05216552_101962 [Pseudoduganella namucuonensis]|uniref:Uncharacterized protein n=1 Tax=Pseudoduganella namucuonensis TaxID=1035707 RepID=A0A1I7KST7_9BURK|nr:hypothetical protein SAMN05216552_101962 [Pseudoduganella namucuonensis]